MEFLWILLVLPSITMATKAEVSFGKEPKITVNFHCKYDSTMDLAISVSSDYKDIDIFSTDPEDSCSVSNGDFTGEGTEFSPYKITIDLNKKTCGAKAVNESFIVEFATRGMEDYYKSRDKRFDVKCGITSNQESSVGHGNYNRHRAYKVEMKLVNATSGEIIDGPVQLGEEVKLRINTKESSDVASIRATLCYVGQLGSNNNTLFYNSKCPLKSYPETNVTFATDKTNPKIIESTEFKAFLYNGENIRVKCLFELCSNQTDDYCLSTDCVKDRTFMRFYSEATASFTTVDPNKSSDTSPDVKSGSSNQMPSMLMLVTVFLIYLIGFKNQFE